MAKYFLVALFFIVSFAPFTPTYACSGGSPITLKDTWHEADTVVQGVIEYADDEGQNGILRVEKVLAGTRVPQRIVLAIYPAADFRRANERFNSGGCWSGVRPFSPHETVVIFLKRLPNGTYDLAQRTSLTSAYYAFPNADSVVNISYTVENDPLVVNDAFPQPYRIKKFNLSQFVQLITELADTRSIQPLMTTPPPLPTTLYIRTINGTEYELPVDFSSPLHIENRYADVSGRIERTGCSTVNCIGTAPNGVDSAQIMSDNTIQILSFVGSRVQGSAFRFSTTSDALAIWDNNTLTLYALPYDRLGFCCFELTFINTISINNDENITDVAWSPDGRQIAYNDAKGLHLWDAFDVGSRPHLLETMNAMSLTPRFFSATGRYLAIQRGQTRLYYDMVNLHELPDGMLSPDDRTLLQFDTWQASPLNLYRLAPFREQNWIDKYNAVRQVEWIDDNRYIAANCDEQQAAECYVWMDSLKTGGAHFKGFMFAYEEVRETLAIAQRNKRIGIFTPTSYNYQVYDLSASLDSEIQAVYWMPPIFYQP